uniref:LysM domain-containing protein n=1 Tax=Acyrthosiphon pisum TaxID=7029 RepID=A0A8R2D8K3_ACYPI|eukprot:XP_016664474.1 PREDICTED: murein hydrolase activator NlpD-like [Acyrthosiphon pisum]
MRSQPRHSYIQDCHNGGSMSTGSTVFQLRRLAALSLVGFWLAGCSSGDNTQAPISQIGGGGDSGMMSSGGGMTSSPSSGGMLSSQNSTVPAMPHGGMLSGGTPSAAPSGEMVVTVVRLTPLNVGDTLFYIAWITGNDFRDLAQRNNVPAPYGLEAGQVLQVGNGNGQTITGGNAITAADATQGGVPVASNQTQIKSAPVAQQPVITYSDDSGSTGGKMLPSKGANNVATTTAPVTAPPTVSSTTNSSTPVGSWRWPTDGKIIDNFSAAEGGNKGVDIAGSRGQPVVATASGRVVPLALLLSSCSHSECTLHNRRLANDSLDVPLPYR